MINKRLKEITLNENGITLVELVISVALLSLVIAVAFSLFVFGNNAYRGGTDQHILQTDMRFALEELTDDLRYATEVKVIEEGNGENQVNLGSLMVESGGVYENVGLYETYLFYSNGEIIRLRRNSKRSIQFDTDEETTPLTFVFQNDKIDISARMSNITGNKNYDVDISIDLLNINNGKGKLDGKDGTNPSQGEIVIYSTPNDFLGFSQAPNIEVLSSSSTKVEVVFNNIVDITELRVMEGDNSGLSENIKWNTDDFVESSTTVLTIEIKNTNASPSSFITGDEIGITVLFLASLLDGMESNFEMNYNLRFDTDGWTPY